MLRPCLLALLFVPALALADDPGKIKDATSRTSHAIQLDGKPFSYDATAGTLTLKDEEGKPQANIYYTAYTKKGNDAKRPITFCFNGGPGSSSVWLHMGAFGPKRIAMTDDGQPLPPPVKLIDNEGTILDLTDIVFIDPVSTGFSRAADEKNAKNFHGLQEDVQVVGDFIRAYTTKNDRWDSPKYLAGESYGTTRASALAGHLESKVGMRVSGVVLVSAVLNFGTIRFDEGNDQPFVFYLPTYAATAWQHKKLGDGSKSLTKHVEDAEAFATGEYQQALFKGSALSDSDRKAVAEKVAKFTGLSAEYVLKSDLRIEGQRFMKELMRSDGKTVGRYDSRYTGQDASGVSERPDYDPSYSAVQGSYTEGFNSYVRKTLKYDTELPYEILTGRVQPWNYGQAGNGRYVNVAPTLRSAMTGNPDLKVFVANGYYDLATPFAATKHTFTHLGGDRKLLDRVTMAYYESGHMMYLHKPSLLKLKDDLAKFYEGKKLARCPTRAVANSPATNSRRARVVAGQLATGPPRLHITIGPSLARRANHPTFRGLPRVSRSDSPRSPCCSRPHSPPPPTPPRSPSSRTTTTPPCSRGSRTTATYAGVHDHDGKLADLSAEAVTKRLENPQTPGDRLLTASATASCPLDRSRSDRHTTARPVHPLPSCWNWKTVQDWKRNPVVYLGKPAEGIDLLMKRSFAPAPERLKSVIGRLKAAPALLASMKANVDNPPKEFADLAVIVAKGSVGFFKTDLTAWAKDAAGKDAKLLAEFEAAEQAGDRGVRGGGEVARNRPAAEGKGEVRHRRRVVFHEAGGGRDDRHPARQDSGGG